MSLAPFRTGQNSKSQKGAKPARADQDLDLVLGCQRGERQAQFELYQRYKDWVFNIAYRMANHQQEAEDMLIDIARGNRNPEVRRKAMFWLGQMGDERAVSFLKEILIK